MIIAFRLKDYTLKVNKTIWNAYEELLFTPLEQAHDLSAFRCNDGRLDRFLKQSALESQNELISATRLALWHGRIVGFFSLINDSISSDLINEGDGLRGYRYDFYPALKIARLATDANYEGHGIGTAMLKEVVATALTITQYSGCRILTVDAKEGVEGFYESFGFVLANDEPEEGDDTVLLYKDLKGTLVEE